MLILVANLGSTSFKCKLFDMTSDGSRETELATAGADRIGLKTSEWSLEARGQKLKGTCELPDHAAAIDLHLKEMVKLGVIQRVSDVEAIGFKAVHGGPISGAVRVDEQVLSTMQQFADVAPQHNPPYIAAMRAFMASLPGVPQVAAFETAFHQTVPASRQVYAIPHEWTEKLGIRRYGFHGASHRYIATRMAQLNPAAKRVINAHLGGSCSLCAISDGKSVANSFGMTVQTGVFHASRVGDFDTFAILKLLKAGQSLDDIWATLGKNAGLKGLSGVSSDMREVQAAAASGNSRARLAVDAFVETCRSYLGSYLAALNGADALVFTGGIGQNDKKIRSAICANLDGLGIVLDEQKNLAAAGNAESRIDDAGKSRTQIWVLPTNEELIVARQTLAVLSTAGSAASVN